MKEKKEGISLSLVAAAAALFIYFFQASIWSESGRFSNILLYIIGICIFFLVLIVGLIIENTIAKDKVFPSLMKRTGILFIIIGCGYYLYRSFQLEKSVVYSQPSVYLRHNIPGIIYFLIMAVSVIVSFMLIKKNIVGSKWLRVTFSGMIVFIQAWFMYAPNFFKDNCGGLYHMDAYTNSIINTLNFAPLEKYSMSIYGHYAIFYVIPVKILQVIGFNQWRSVTLTIALIGGISFAMVYWTIYQVVDNDIIFIMAVLANAVVSTQIYYDQYYQVLPHRYLFQSLILAGVAFIYKKENRKNKITKTIMWILAGAAIVWNTETGMVCAIVWMAGSIYLDAEKKDKYTVKNMAKHVGILIIVITGAYAFVNFYNILVGGNTITFRTFIYPVGSESYPIEKLQLALQIPCAGYMLPILLFMCTLGYYMIRVLKINLDRKTYIVILSAIMGIGVYTYYMNRAVSSNASIVSFTFTLVAAYLLDQNIEKKDIVTDKKISVIDIGSAMCFVAIVSMVVSSIGTFGQTLSNKVQTTFEKNSLNQFVEETKDKIPDGTVAFGIGTAQLFSYMDLNTGIYITDWPDLDGSLDGGKTIINPEALDYLVQRLKIQKYPYILVNSLQAEYIPDKYLEVERFEYYDFSFVLYKNRKKNKLPK